MAQCEQSLRRLQTSYIDLYWMHAWDASTPIQETMRALDDLVTEGKVRYIGFSDTPAWKCAEAQTMATLRGWTPLIALQIEYSLLQRTVEGELTPMARELGLGVTPWAPLARGVLSGKYARGDHGKHQPSRGERVTSSLDDKAYDIVDELVRIAKEHGSTASRVAIAWVMRAARGQPWRGRRLAQANEIAKLDALSTPSLLFPTNMLAMTPTFINGGTTINGQGAAAWPATPANDAERY